MSDPPSPPLTVPDELATALTDCSPTQLRAVARYAERLAAHRDRGDSSGDDERADGGPDEAVDTPVDQPTDVPARATLTVKEINDNRYYYWQWREGDRVRSRYARPVNPDR